MDWKLVKRFIAMDPPVIHNKQPHREKAGLGFLYNSDCLACKYLEAQAAALNEVCTVESVKVDD